MSRQASTKSTRFTSCQDGTPRLRIYLRAYSDSHQRPYSVPRLRLTIPTRTCHSMTCLSGFVVCLRSEPRLLGIDGERIVQNAATPAASKISSLFTKAATPKRVFYIRDIKILKIDEHDSSVLHLGFADGGQVSVSPPCSEVIHSVPLPPLYLPLPPHSAWH